MGRDPLKGPKGRGMSQDLATVKLEETLDLRAAQPLAQSLLEKRGHPLELDASEVGRLGALCLQVLLAAQKTWSEDGQTFSIGTPSVDFTEALSAFGLVASHFDVSEVSQ